MKKIKHFLPSLELAPPPPLLAIIAVLVDGEIKVDQTRSRRASGLLSYYCSISGFAYY